MPNEEYLDFDNEGVDSGSPLIATYGSEWRRWLLAAVQQLKNPDVWDPDCNVDLACRYAEELIYRLMGTEVEVPQLMAMSPLSIPVTGLPEMAPETMDWSYCASDNYFRMRAKSGPGVSTNIWTFFRVTLPAGGYYLKVYADKNIYRGKLRIQSSDTAPEIDETHDLYAPALDSLNVIEIYFIVQEAGECVFRFYKDGKNPAALGGVIVVSGIVITAV